MGYISAVMNTPLAQFIGVLIIASVYCLIGYMIGKGRVREHED